MSTTVKRQGQKDTFDGDINENRATAFYLVISDTPISAVAARAASGVPGYFDAHSDDGTLLVKQKRARALTEDSGRFHWEVQIDYSDKITNPLDTPADFDWDFSEASEDYFIDTEGDAVVNTSGNPFDAIPQRETGSITCTITKNVAADFDVTLFLNFRDKINSSGFTVDGVSIDTSQAKFSGANVSPVKISNGVSYRTVKMVIKFKQTWNDEIADFGYYGLDSGTLKAIATDGTLFNPPSTTKQMVQKPWPLNGSGVPQTNATDAPASITFYPYYSADFADLSALF